MSDTSSPIAALGGAPGQDDAVIQLYGYMAWALNIPEVSDILRKAAADAAVGQPWATDKLQGALKNTSWWKTTSDSERQWEQTMAEDPGQAQQQIGNLAAQIRSELIQQGVALDDSRIRQVAEQSLRWNWSNDQTKAALDLELQRAPGVLMSKVGVDFKALASQFAVPISDAQIQTWAAHAISGEKPDELFRQYLVQQANQRFRDNHELLDYIAKGGTPSQYFDPYKQIAGQTLGVNPDNVDLSDPKWSAAINSTIDDKGTIGPMSYSQWETYLKTNAAFNYQATQQGQADQSSLADTIGKLFGKKAM